MLITVYFKGLGGWVYFFLLFWFFIIRNKENYKSSCWLFQTSSNHNIEKFLIIPFLIYAGVILSISLSHYYLFSLIITSFNQGVCIQLAKSNWIPCWFNCTSHFHNLCTVYCFARSSQRTPSDSCIYKIQIAFWQQVTIGVWKLES